MRPFSCRRHGDLMLGYTLPSGTRTNIDKLGKFLKENTKIKIALLSVPDSVAQEMLDDLIGFGIKGIVNFAPRILRLPETAKDVHLVNDCIGASLYKIVYQIYNKQRK